MRLEEREACGAFHPEEAGIMLDRLAIELLHALAKNPTAVPALQHEADELLSCVGTWLATTDPDELPTSPQLTASELEPSELAQTLHDLGEHLLMLAAIADAASGRRRR
jgi:hypothetical protein